MCKSVAYLFYITYIDVKFVLVVLYTMLYNANNYNKIKQHTLIKIILL